MQLEPILTAIQYLLGLGPTIMMPVIICALSVMFGAPLVKSARSGIAYGIGFLGINMVLGIIFGALAPVSNALVTTVGFRLKAIDLGWPYCASVAWMWPGAPIIFPLLIGFNLVLLALGPERGGTFTMDVDLWNYWSESYTIFLIYTGTGNLPLAILFGGLIYFYICMRPGDWGACLTQDPETYNFPSITWSGHPFGYNIMPAMFIDKYFTSKIPGIVSSKLDPQGIRDKFGLIGDPIFIGFFIGLILGLVGMSTGKVSIQAALNLTMSTAAVMLLMPRMIGILMEGLLPLSDAAKTFMEKRFPGRTFAIGLDWAIAAGYLPIIAAGVLLVPVALLLSLIMPGNIALPYADLALGLCFAMWPAAAGKGNVLRAFITSIPMVAIGLLWVSFLAPMCTYTARLVNMPVPEGFLVTSFVLALVYYDVILSVIPIYFFGGDFGHKFLSGELVGMKLWDPFFPVMLSFAWIAFDIIAWWLCRDYPYRIRATTTDQMAKRGVISWEELKKLPLEKKKEIAGLPKKAFEK